MAVDSLDAASTQIGQALDHAAAQLGTTIDYYVEMNGPANRLNLFVFSDAFDGKPSSVRYRQVLDWVQHYAPDARSAIATVLTMTQAELKAYQANPPISGSMMRFGSTSA